MDNLKEKTAKGLFWGVVNSGTTQVLNLVIGIFLGRLLSPAEYGVVGVLTIFTAVAGAIQASGFTQGLVNMKSPTDGDYNSVFWFNILASVTIYAVLFVSAPAIAAFFHQPCITAVSRFVFLCLPVSALGIACNGYMLKNMMNRELAIVNTVALVTSGVTGILLAFNGYSYWSLAWQQLIYIVVTNIMRYYFVSWRPSLTIDFGPVRRMFSFCVRLLVTNIINIVNQHLLTLVFGRLFPISAVGNYSQANKWNTMANSVVSTTIGQVSQPVLVSISSEEDREVRVFRKLMRFAAFLSFPAMFGLALVAREFLLLTIGRQWEGCVVLLQILCCGGAFVPLHVLYQNLVITKGESTVYMWCNISQIAVQFLLILLCYRHGMVAIVCAYSASTVLWLFVWQVIARRMLNVGVWDVLKDIVPFLAVSLFVMAVTFLLTVRIGNLYLLLASRVLLAAALYTAVMRLLHAEVLNECLRFVFSRAHR